MAYNEFTVEMAEDQLGVVVGPGDLFPKLQPVSVPSWLVDTLARGTQLALLSEKARSEFIVAPVLLAVREQSGDRVAIFSGQRLDVDPQRQLVGECDFLLTRSEPVPRLRAPIMAIVEAKKNDIESGLGQCVAQMVAARIFNDRAGQPVQTIHGCVTTGEDWQFLGLKGTRVTLHRSRLYLTDVELILAAFHQAVQDSSPG